MDPRVPYGIGSDVWPGVAKVIEECGETLELLGKIMGCGGTLKHAWACKNCEGSGKIILSRRCPYCDGTGIIGHGDLSDAIHDELGDLRAALDFLIETNDELDADVIDARAQMKLERFRTWRETGVF